MADYMADSEESVMPTPNPAPIPDPDAPTTRAIGLDGALLGGVFVRSGDAGPDEPWRHIGWSSGFEFSADDQDES